MKHCLIFGSQVFAANTAEVLTYHQVPVTQKHPQEGWIEQDPMELLGAVQECLTQTVHNLQQLSIDPADIIAIGVTNQRETTIVWDSLTGKPLYNAIGMIYDLIKLSHSIVTLVFNSLFS